MIQLIAERRITACQWCPPQQPGDAFWVKDEQAARHLVEAGLAKLLDAAEPDVNRGPLRRSPNWPIDRFAIVERVWEGETVVIVASGPSLAAADLERARGRAKVIAVNDNYLVAPWADVCYFADARWWKWHTDGIAKSWPWAKFNAAEVRERFAAFAGQKVTIENTGMLVADPAVFMLHNFGREGLSEKPNGLHTGSNSGYQAINLAVLAGAKRVLLLGFDMRFPGGRSHAHDGHPTRVPEVHYSEFARRFATMLPQLKTLGVEVVNCTPGSAIKAFPAMKIEQAIAGGEQP